jgi:stearoyl-CoA desaturase (delta-9 desaturase)
MSHNQLVRSLQVLNHILLLSGLIIVFYTGQYYYLLISLLTYWFIGVFGINIGMHRLISHRSFKTHPLIEKALALISVLTTVGSPLAWTAIHRQHHRKTETDEDPHSPIYLGNFKAWFGFWGYKKIDLKLVRDIRTDSYHRFLHKKYFWIILTYCLILFLINPLLVIFAYSIPACFCLHSTSAIIVIAHRHGYKTYDLKKDQSRNSWIASLITLGEGWHNNHHAKPYNWKSGEKWWEFDLPAFFIRLIKVD